MGEGVLGRPLVLVGLLGLAASGVVVSTLPAAWEIPILRSALLGALPQFFTSGFFALALEAIFSALEHSRGARQKLREIIGEKSDVAKKTAAPSSPDSEATFGRRLKKVAVVAIGHSLSFPGLRIASVVACLLTIYFAGLTFTRPFNVFPGEDEKNRLANRWTCVIEAFQATVDKPGSPAMFSEACSKLLTSVPKKAWYSP